MKEHPSLVFSLALLLAAFGATGRAQNLNSGVNGQITQSAKAANNYQIGPGDVLLIEVAGEPDLKRKTKVTEQGTIRLPHINRDLKIAGLSELQAAELLNKEFLVILKEPQVTVFIEEYNAQFVGVAGAVKNPKRFPLTRELRVYDLLSEGGGLTDKAGEIVQLIHTKGSEEIETIVLKELFSKPELNRVIRNGDLLNVPEAGVIYIEGTVKNAGVFPLKENVTLTQAIAMAGGLAQDAKRKEIRLWRANGAERTEQIFNYDEIGKNPKKDPLLRPYDIVLVPEATATKQARSLVQAFAGGLSSALGWGIFR